MRSSRRVGALIVAVALLVFVGCTPSPPAAATTDRFAEVCTPQGALWDRLDITFVQTPTPSSLFFSSYRFLGIGTDQDGISQTFDAAGRAGQTVSVEPARQGSCLHLAPEGGLVYRYQPVLATDAGAWLAKEVHRSGYVRGTVLPYEGAAPATIAGLTGVTSMDLTSAHTCAVAGTGQVWCWGENTYGELGDGTTTSRSTPAPVPGLDDAVQVTVGRSHTCALRSDHTVACWGRNQEGQLGDGSTVDSAVPVEVAGLTNVTKVEAGLDHTCAIAAGAIRCWGEDRNAVFGNGTIDVSTNTMPVAATGLTGVADFSTSNGTACAILDGGALWCWGRDTFGNLDGVSPIEMGIGDAVDVSVGFVDSCVLRATGEVLCWGSPQGGSIYRTTTPVTVPGAAGATDVAVGGGDVCVLMGSGDVRCWGQGDEGQLGVPGGPDSWTPVTVPTVSGAAALSAGGGNACALIGGALRCWGVNHEGQLGHPSS
jgi:hypothetical protein